MKQPSPKQISDYFKEWKGSKRERYPLPTPAQCEEIAELFEPDRTFGFLDDDDSDLKFRRLEQTASAHVKKIEAMAWKLRAAIETYGKTMAELGATAGVKIPKKIKESGESPTDYIEHWYNEMHERSHVVPVLSTSGISRLTWAVADYLRFSPPPKKGKRENYERNRLIYNIANDCRDVLIRAGWPEASLDTDDGAVAYVTARCISFAEGKTISPKTAATIIYNFEKRDNLRRGKTYWVGLKGGEYL